MQIDAPLSSTFELPAGQALTVVADGVSTGNVYRLGNAAGDAGLGTTPIAASTTTAFGPYAIATRFQVDVTAGHLTVAQSQADPVGTDELAALVANYLTENPQEGVAESLISGDANNAIEQGEDDQLYVDATAFASAVHVTDTANPHSVTKSQVGLANVDNTADVDKPVSTAQATADAAIGTAAASDATTKANARMATDGSNAALPTSDPAVAGALWNNLGVVTVSAGA